MNSLFDVLLQCVKDKFPLLTWKLGSVVRSMLIDPLTSISEETDLYVEKLRALTDLQGLLDNPVGREDEIDYWLSQFGLSLPEERLSAGEVTLVLSSLDPFSIPEGSDFSWSNGIVLRSQRQVSISATSSDVSMGAAGLYHVKVPVQSVGAALSLDAGAPVSWSSAPAQVVDMFVSSAITGGVSRDPLQVKVNLIRGAITQPAMCGADAIRASLIRKYGETIVDVALGAREKTNADVVVPMYVKQYSLPTTVSTRVEGVLQPADDTDGQNYMALTMPAVGLAYIQKITDESSGEVAEIVKTQLKYTDSGEQLTILVAAPTDTANSEIATSRYYLVEASVFEHIRTAGSWLNSTQCGSPFKMVIHSPVYAKVKMQLNVGVSEINTGALEDLCDYINGSKLGVTLSDAAVREILNKHGYTLRSAVLYVADVRSVLTTTAVSRTGSLTFDGISNIQTMEPVAAYCSFEDIKTY